MGAFDAEYFRRRMAEGYKMMCVGCSNCYPGSPRECGKCKGSRFEPLGDLVAHLERKGLPRLQTPVERYPQS